MIKLNAQQRLSVGRRVARGKIQLIHSPKSFPIDNTLCQLHGGKGRVRNMYSIILCAGLGQRLYPITTLYAKPFIKVIDKSLIEWSITRLLKEGVTDIAITLFHKSDSILALDLQEKYPDCQLQFIIEPRLLGTGQGLQNAINKMGGDDLIIAVNGDALWSFELHDAIGMHSSVNAQLSLILSEVATCDFTPVAIDDDSLQIQSIGNLTWGCRKGASVRTYTGLALLSRYTQEYMRGRNGTYLMDDFIVPFANLGNPLHGITLKGFWADLGTPSRYLYEVIRFAREVAGNSKQYVQGRMCNVAETALLENCILWDNVTIGDQCSISHSILTSGVTISPGTEVNNMIVFPPNSNSSANSLIEYSQDDKGNWYSSIN